MKKKSFIAVSLSLMLLSVHTPFASADGAQTHAWIDKTITGHERAVISGVLENLPENERENVVYINDKNEVFANKQGLIDDWKKAELIEGRTYAIDGQRVTAPAETIAPAAASCAKSDGPYRKVESKSGYAWYGGNVYLPSASKKEMYDENKPNGNGDTAHIYTGGVGGGQEVDAGFFHQSTNDDWAMFIRNNGYVYGPRFEAGQTMQMKFYVPANDQVALYVVGKKKGESSPISYTLVKDVKGWTKDGKANRIKRNTTIATTKGTHSGTFMKNVYWNQSYIGLSSSSNSQWLSAQTEGYCSVPSGSKDDISVNFINAGEETVSITIK